ncbi:MAG: hypothetical protein QGF71_05310, partial [Rhodospirillales bacterium]|nr:hypothetical protein [Rhodospirillales bacterium]
MDIGVQAAIRDMDILDCLSVKLIWHGGFEIVLPESTWSRASYGYPDTVRAFGNKSADDGETARRVWEMFIARLFG